MVAEELGRGRAVAGVTIADDTSASPTTIDLTLAARNVNVSYASTPTGATILIGGTAVGTAGGAAVPRLENAFPYTFVARLDGYLDSAATTVNLAPNEAGAANRWNLGTLTQSAPAVTLTPRTVTGTITGGSAATSVRATNGATTIVGTVAAGGGVHAVAARPAGPWTIVAEQLGVGRGTGHPHDRRW